MLSFAALTAALQEPVDFVIVSLSPLLQKKIHLNTKKHQSVLQIQDLIMYKRHKVPSQAKLY